MRTKFLILVSVALIAALGVSCDLGINPLLFDGSPVTATYRVDATGNSYDTTITIDLHDILADIDKSIDSIKVFNITLQIDSTAGTAPGTTVTGEGYIDNLLLLSINGDSISRFATERSIFDTTSTGLSYADAGVAHLVAVLKMDPLPTVTLRARGTASTSNLHFTIKLRLYTQVFTPPPKG